MNIITPQEENRLRQLLTDGANFKTTGRNGKTKPRVVWCSKDLNTVYCSESKKAWMPKEIKSDSISDIVEEGINGCEFAIVTPKKRLRLQVLNEVSSISYLMTKFETGGEYGTKESLGVFFEEANPTAIPNDQHTIQRTASYTRQP
jgi:uncharacterized protein YpmB